MSLAETMLAGGDFLSDLDHQRKDAAGLALRAVPEVPAATAVIGTWTIVRRVEVHRGELAGDTRSRRRRTIDPGHPILLEVGEVEVAYAYSFIMTNVSGGICKIEAWFEVRGPRRGDAEGWKRGGGALPLPVGEVRGQRRLGAVRHPRSQPLAMAGDARGRPRRVLGRKDRTPPAALAYRAAHHQWTPARLAQVGPLAASWLACFERLRWLPLVTRTPLSGAARPSPVAPSSSRPAAGPTLWSNAPRTRRHYVRHRITTRQRGIDGRPCH